MCKMISALSITALLAAVSAVSLSSAAMSSSRGKFDQQDRYIQNFCSANPHANDCNDWRSNRGHWDNNRYQSFYRNHQSDRVFNSSAVASIFGLTISVGAPGPVNTGPNHIQACHAHFHSYNERTDSYMGYDHRWHRCMY